MNDHDPPHDAEEFEFWKAIFVIELQRTHDAYGALFQPTPEGADARARAALSMFRQRLAESQSTEVGAVKRTPRT